ncbi:probable serine/threonine protein kinase IRE [Aristolochia californica]|uniref:probable serine/threonine protein kinase IRE n=1 Tax=Aristolochia californica TaxID=171875 RepID=UPI0035DD7804
MPSPSPTPDDASLPSTSDAPHNEPTPPPSASTLMRSKLRKIPHIPIRRGNAVKNDNAEEETTADKQPEQDHSSAPIAAFSLGLNHIRTRSTRFHLRFSTPPAAVDADNAKNKNKDRDVPKDRLRVRLPPLPPLGSFLPEHGKKNLFNQSKSLRGPFPPYPEAEGHLLFVDTAKSQRFQAIVRVTSGRRKITSAKIKSYSHELNSKGVRPFPVRKPRWLSHPEDIMAVIRKKFDKLKEEVDSDLGIFAGDLVGILEKNVDFLPEWRNALEDLLVLARQCAKMSPADFWSLCEGIVQKLDDRRQELQMGIVKQVHTRLLFILTRCTRLLQFHKEGCLAEGEHILGLHQLSDLGVYSGQVSGYKSFFSGKDLTDKTKKSSHGHDQDGTKPSADQGSDTAKNPYSTPSKSRISSWKKLPSATEKNQKKGEGAGGSPPSVHIVLRDEAKMVMDENTENESLELAIGTFTNMSDSSTNKQKILWNIWGEQHIAVDGDSMICRICDNSIPTDRVEYHSRICTIADRCDLKGLTINGRLERLAETLERILESYSPKSTDTSEGSPRAAERCITEDCDAPFPTQCNNSQALEELNDFLPNSDHSLITDDQKDLLSTSSKINNAVSFTTRDRARVASSSGSITPRSPLLTSWTSQVGILFSGSRLTVELENIQIQTLLDITLSIARVDSYELRSMKQLISCLGALRDLHRDMTVNALFVDTFGRRIEKLLQDKYVELCGQMEDYKLECSSFTAEEDNIVVVEDDISQSLRTSPSGSNHKERTSIQDFEIIKPISRGAFGRVFLARKRVTGDLFAIKVLRKADMIRKNAVESILSERDILISARNPFVVRFFYSFTCRENLYLVMEYLNGGDLYSLLRNLGCLEEERARIYIAEVVLALEYLHSVNVIHRDLKPDNLLIASDGHIKLTDFGLSKVGLIDSTDDLSGPSVFNSSLIGKDESNSTSTVQTQKREERQKQSVVGTPDYLAPEILLGMGHGTTADWWSVGIILYELLVGIPPFNAQNPQKIFDNIMNRDMIWPRVPEEISYEAYDLINKLLIENPYQRLGVTGAQEVKRHPFFKNINWDTLARQKAAFIPPIDAYDTSYFASRYIWNPADEEVLASAHDYDDKCDSSSVSCSSSSPHSYENDEEVDTCGHLADLGGPNLQVKYSFSNFSFKNLSQLASINYDMMKNTKNPKKSSYPPVP